MQVTLPGYEVIYLTGAPAAGKSSVAKALDGHVSPLSVFEYGARLSAHLTDRTRETLSQESLRERSSAVASHADIVAVDQALIEFVATHRSSSHVLIDSHAVTKESYGYRITPFSVTRLCQLAPTMIIVLFASPEETVRRIAAAPGGRPVVSAGEADFHTALQAGVASSYAIQLGIPAYFVESHGPIEGVAVTVAQRITRYRAAPLGLDAAR